MATPELGSGRGMRSACDLERVPGRSEARDRREVPLLSEKTPGKLIVTHKTLLKPSTEQSGYISKKDMKSIDPGEYQLLNVEASEEGHYYIEIEGIEGQWFIFSGHAQVRSR